MAATEAEGCSGFPCVWLLHLHQPGPSSHLTPLYSSDPIPLHCISPNHLSPHPALSHPAPPYLLPSCPISVSTQAATLLQSGLLHSGRQARRRGACLGMATDSARLHSHNLALPRMGSFHARQGCRCAIVIVMGVEDVIPTHPLATHTTGRLHYVGRDLSLVRRRCFHGGVRRRFLFDGRRARVGRQRPPLLQLSRHLPLRHIWEGAPSILTSSLLPFNQNASTYRPAPSSLHRPPTYLNPSRTVRIGPRLHCFLCHCLVIPVRCV